jgi:hypothetical protein
MLSLIEDYVLKCCVPQQTELKGSAFGIVALTLGHCLSIWKDQLTRDQRSMLYAAQAHLVPLHANSNIELSWLKDPKKSRILGLTCSDCSERFDSVWRISFGLCGTLNPPALLEDVSKIASLPQCRQLIAHTARAPSWQCKKKCNKK